MRGGQPMRWAGQAVVALTLSGCAWLGGFFGETDNTEPPTPLTDIEARVTARVLWSASIGEGPAGQWLDFRPAVADGRVFASGREGRVRALDLENGRVVWTSETQAPISTGPGFGQGVVAVGTSDARVLAFDAGDGTRLWETSVSSEVLSPPQPGSGVVSVRTVDGRLAGLALETGERVWAYDRSTPALTLRGTSAAVGTDGSILSGFDTGHAVAVSAKDGRVLWDRRVAVPRGRSELQRLVDIDASPVVQGTAAYVAAYNGRISALDIRDGQVLWSREMSSYAGLSADSKRVYVADDISQIWALDRFTGASFWKQDKLKWRNATAPAVVDDLVVVGDLEGYLHVLSAQDGGFVGRVQVAKAGLSAAPVVVDETVIVFDDSGRVSALRLER